MSGRGTARRPLPCGPAWPTKAGNPIPARYRGGPCCGAVHLPAPWEPGILALYAKITRRIGFFDEAGWVPLVRFAPGGEAGA